MNKSLLLCALLLLTGCVTYNQFPQRNSVEADRAAIIDLQHRYVLARDFFDADGYAAVFTDRGVVRGDVVGVLSKNRPEALFAALAAVMYLTRGLDWGARRLA